MAYNSHMNQPPASKHGEYRKPSRRRKTGVSALLTFLVVIMAVIFVMSVFFRVTDIQVEGNEHYTDEEIIKAVVIEKGDNLFFFDRIAATSRVFAKLPYIEEVSVERQLPHKVIISVQECKALAYLQVGDEEWAIDHSCKILGKANETETGELIPILGVSPGTLMIGEKLTTSDGNEELVNFIAEVLYQLQERGLAFKVNKIDFSDPYSVRIAYGDGRYTFKIGGSSNVEYKFGMIVSVMNQLKEGDVGTIDVSDGTSAHFIPN